MYGKTLLLLVMALHTCVIGLPLDYTCCSEDGDDLASSTEILALSPPIYWAPVDASADDPPSWITCDDERCFNVNPQTLAQVLKSKRSSAPAASIQREKRFPIHLDPLYQYRFLARSGQCPTAKDGQPEYYCPTPDKMGNWRCIDDFQLCDGVRHCPNGEDELPVSCLFFRVVETHLSSVSQRLTNDENRREQQQQHQKQQQQKKGPR